MYVIVKYTEDGRRAGFVRSYADRREAAKFGTFRAAHDAAVSLNKTSNLYHEVDLASEHDCAADAAAFMVHA